VARCRWIIVIALGVLAAYETGDAQAIAANAPASRFVLTGDVQEMPILLVKGYAIKEGTLRLESDGRSYLLNNIRIDGVLVKSVPHVEIHHEPFAAAKPIGITGAKYRDLWFRAAESVHNGLGLSGQKDLPAGALTLKCLLTCQAIEKRRSAKRANANKHHFCRTARRSWLRSVFTAVLPTGLLVMAVSAPRCFHSWAHLLAGAHVSTIEDNGGCCRKSAARLL
jgi:hypothetical protein